MKKIALVIALVGLVGLVGLMPSAHAAAATTYSSRAAFNSAAAGLPVETFSHTSTTFANACNAPLSDANPGPCFSSLLHGPTYDVGAGAICFSFGNGCLAEFAPNTWGNPDYFLVANYFVDTMQIHFAAPGVEALGFNVQDIDICGGPSQITVTASGASGVVASQTVDADAAESNFWGVTSGTPITELNLSDTGNCFFVPGAEGVAQMAFGTPTSTTAHAFVPSLGLSSTSVTSIGGAAVSGGTVTFHQDLTGDATATTDGSGNASCCTVTGAGGIVLGGGSYSATLAGGYPYVGSSGSAGLI